MKKFGYFALALSALFFSSCDDEDGFYNEKYIDVPNLVTVENQDVYLVGEFIYISADISRYQAEPGFATPLDLFETTSGATGFRFSYIVERETSAGVWQEVTVTAAQMLIDKGSVQASSYVLGTAQYDSSDESYEYRVGYPLTSAGNYRISFGVNSDAANLVELRSLTQGNNLFLNINSATTQLNPQGFYTFTVN
ncbi:hypothetical protein [Flavobacterium selenitireducens]|uniref:hypothetical protein n=1 Tax=Flavobacterium selenitireducens TaxID=2722704 RepID=UPI00168ADAF6|nr:hypothetical protein [Flavobacterium selenitireducens]MBD3580976.1 hypothetical protein [Flavobacterium selenitireducens]